MGKDVGDAELVELARAGDKRAFAELLDRHGPLLFRMCRRVLGDPDLARDATQEAALQALLGLERLRQPERFGPWLAGIGLNVCRSWLRHRPRECWSWEAMQGGRQVLEPLAPAPDPAEVVELAELAARVRRAVEGLPRGQRAAVLLFYVSDLSYAETAAQLGIEVSAVKTRLHKARAVLRRRLTALWEETSMPDARTLQSVNEQAVEMRVIDVRRTPPDESHATRHVVALEEIGGARTLLIWVGQFEGTTLAVLLEKAETARPLTYAFAASILEAAGGNLREVLINTLAEETFYAVAVVHGPDGVRQVDARPSDALSLALVTGAPIFVEPAVLSTVEQQPPPADIRPEEWRLSGLRHGSVGSAEIVSEMREQWRKEGWKQKTETPSEGGA